MVKKMKIKVKSIARKILADTITPVSIYLKLRDQFAGAVLLESSDYHGSENSLSYICCDGISEFKVENGRIHSSNKISSENIIEAFKEYLGSFRPEPLENSLHSLRLLWVYYLPGS